MNETLFVLGRTPQLAFEEIVSFYPRASLVTDTVAIIHESAEAKTIIRELGGTVKIVRVLKHTTAFTPQTAAAALSALRRENKLTFGISVYGESRIPSAFIHAVKRLFESEYSRVRFVESKHGQALTSVVVEKQRVKELVAVFGNGEWIIGVTEAVQPYEEWNTRDYARPKSDPKAGMLPPKVSRMIVNIALPRREGESAGVLTLLDPFCGVGTVLIEGMLRGARVLGCDISKDAVNKAKKNLDWAKAQYGLMQAETNVFVCDATHVSDLVGSESVDAIATEPFLGDPVSLPEGQRMPAHKAKNILKGLQKLYIGSLKQWREVLKPKGRIVMAMPAYETDRGIMRVKNVVDRCEKFGYTRSIGPIEYSRPQAIVRREFFVFEKI